MAPSLPTDLPLLSEVRRQALRDQIKDFQITNGSLIELLPGINHAADAPAGIRTLGVSMTPTPFPRKLYDRVIDLQPLLNELYIRVAADPEWLGETLAEMIENDEFTRHLWSIWKDVRAQQLKTERIVLGIFRSDYMLHDELGNGQDLGIRQIEFNTFGCAAGVNGNIVADMHRYLCYTGSFVNIHNPPTASILPTSLPSNSTLSDLISSLRTAYSVYTSTYKTPTQPGILFLALPCTPSSPDERPIEQLLWSSSPHPIPTYRCSFPDEVLSRTTLTSTGTLLYQSPHAPTPIEIAVVYFRAGHQPHDYAHGRGVQARLRLERSRAISCPDILGQLATFKKVQQALTAPGGVERFLAPADAARLRATWARMLPLDKESTAAGREARRIVASEEACAGWILKASLDGGGNNIYGADIVSFLKGVDEREWGNYVLMERIRPPRVSNVLLTWEGEYEGLVVSELGVFGMGIWVKGPDGKFRIERNENAGWLFESMAAGQEESDLVQGRSCYDSPRLID